MSSAVAEVLVSLRELHADPPKPFLPKLQCLGTTTQFQVRTIKTTENCWNLTCALAGTRMRSAKMTMQDKKRQRSPRRTVNQRREQRKSRVRRRRRRTRARSRKQAKQAAVAKRRMQTKILKKKAAMSFGPTKLEASRRLA